MRDEMFLRFPVFNSNSVSCTYAEESGAPIALIRAGVFYRVVKDHLGSVRLVVNATTGEVAQSIDYDAYGRVIRETGAGFQPFGFAGGLYDATTKLVRFGARDYDPSTGRWTNKDPIGFAGQQGNVYLYVNGDPVNRLDLRGTADLFLGIEADAIVGDSGGNLGFGVVLDTDHVSESGIYFSGGRGIGVNVGVGIGGGVCFRDIEGSGWEGDANVGIVSPVIIGDAGGVSGGGISVGPGIGGAVTKTKTVTVSFKTVGDAFNRLFTVIGNWF
jgi:RHS repeat-associated protein